MSFSSRLVRRVVGPAAAAALLIVGIAPARATRPLSNIDWPTHGFDVQRSHYNPNETILSTSSVPGLHKIWSFDMGTATNAQPVVGAGVLVGGTPTDIVYVGAKNGNLYAVNADTGALVWQTFVGIAFGTQCGGPYGVDGSGAIDRATNRIYVAGGDDKVYALDLSTGAIASGWPVIVTTNVTKEHIWSSVTFFNGKLYVPVASYCDQSPYHGKLMLINTVNPTQTKNFIVTNSRTILGGGIWGPGGASIDPVNGHVYVATGNAINQNESAGYSEHVVRLNATLKVLSSNFPGPFGLVDSDFGSTPTLYRPPGCPPLLATKNKNGELFVYNRDSISTGPLQGIQVAGSVQGNGLFQGDAAYDPVTNMVYIANSTDSDDGVTYLHGLLAFAVQTDCTLALAWQATVGINNDVNPPPTVANGVVYYGTASASQLYAFDAATGAELWNSGTTITGPVYNAPTVVNGRVYIGTYDNNLYAFGL